MSARPEQPEPFLRGWLYPAWGETPYPRVNPADVERLPADTWQAAQVPVGVRLEFVGDARAVQIRYRTTSANLGYRGEGAGCTFAVFRSGQKLAEAEAVLGDGVVELGLGGDPGKPAIVYLPEGMRPVIVEVGAVGGELRPAPRQPRWLAYGDAVTQGWLASSPSMAWPALAGRKLGLDVCNLGYAGSARGDTAMAVHLADTPAEVVSVSVGFTPWGRVPSTPGLVAEQLRAFLAVVRAGHPNAPLVVVSPTLRPDAEQAANRAGATLAELRLAAEEAVRERMAAGDGRLFLVEGATVVSSADLADGVYPGDEGHKRLAAAVGKYLTPLMEELRQSALARWQEEVVASVASVGSIGSSPPPGAATAASVTSAISQDQPSPYQGTPGQPALSPGSPGKPAPSPGSPGQPLPSPEMTYPQTGYPQVSDPAGGYPPVASQQFPDQSVPDQRSGDPTASYQRTDDPRTDDPPVASTTAPYSGTYDQHAWYLVTANPEAQDHQRADEQSPYQQAPYQQSPYQQAP